MRCLHGLLELAPDFRVRSPRLLAAGGDDGLDGPGGVEGLVCAHLSPLWCHSQRRIYNPSVQAHVEAFILAVL